MLQCLQRTKQFDITEEEERCKLYALARTARDVSFVKKANGLSKSILYVPPNAEGVFDDEYIYQNFFIR